MCMTRKPTAVLPWPAVATSATGPVAVQIPDHVTSTVERQRRRRLWELSPHAACPVLGVCVPLPLLRQLMGKARLDTAQRSDYDLHTIAVAECRRRSPLAEAVHKALDERFALALRQVRTLKGSEALKAHWGAALERPDWAGDLWALLTHADMTSALEYEVLGQVHMLQHQVGMVVRLEQRKVDDLRSDHRQWRHEREAAQQRLQDQTREWGARLEAKDQALMRLRAELVRQVSLTADAQQALNELRQQVPDLEARERLAQHNTALQAQVTALQATVRQLRREAAQRATAQAVPIATADAGGRWAPPTAPDVASAPCQWMVAPMASAVPLQSRRVLCIGGRPAHVPAYRSLVESRGAAFLHHDGGQEDSLTQLPANLAAADLVICQVGCISHNAYWRVKEHCKRTGTPCAFVESPSRSALERALEAITTTSLPEAPTND